MADPVRNLAGRGYVMASDAPVWVASVVGVEAATEATVHRCLYRLRFGAPGTARSHRSGQHPPDCGPKTMRMSMQLATGAAAARASGGCGSCDPHGFSTHRAAADRISGRNGRQRKTAPRAIFLASALATGPPSPYLLNSTGENEATGGLAHPGEQLPQGFQEGPQEISHA